MKSDLPSLTAWVESAALELALRDSLAEIEAKLVSEGASPETAIKLVLLTPSAFAREHYEPRGIKFPDHFLVGPSGGFLERPYSSEPIYAEARLLARRWLSESRLSLVMRVLDWSAEAKCIKQAGESGRTPTEISAVHHGF